MVHTFPPSRFCIRIRLKSPLWDAWIHAFYSGIFHVLQLLGHRLACYCINALRLRGSSPGAQVASLFFCSSCLCLQEQIRFTLMSGAPCLSRLWSAARSLLISPVLFSLDSDSFSHGSLLSEEKTDLGEILSANCNVPSLTLVDCPISQGLRWKLAVGGHPSIFFDVWPCLDIRELLCTPRTCVYVFFYFWIWKYSRCLSLGNILFHILVLAVQTGLHILNKPSLWKNHLKKIGIRNGFLKGQ